MMKRQDVRPGLCRGGAKRDLDIYKKRMADIHVPVAEQEEQARSKGLNTALDEKNKGFLLLQKCLNQKNTGVFDAPTTSTSRRKDTDLVTPIPIVIKKSRAGLGKGSSTPAAAIEKLTVEQLAEFRAKERDNGDARQLISDIKSSQKACYNLDSEAGITEPGSDFFWPYRVVQEMKEKTGDEGEMSESDIENDQLDVLQAKLRQLTTRLKGEYLYCIWCGIRFETESDLVNECPGDSRQSHD